MAPELIRRGGELTPAADVFALGCLLFEALTGRPAFERGEAEGDPDGLAGGAGGKAPRGIVGAAPSADRRAGHASSLRSQLGGELPAELTTLIERMLSHEPDDRPRDAAVVKAALAALRVEPGEAPRRPARTPSLTRSEQRLLSVALVGRPMNPGAAPGSLPAPYAEASALAALHGGHVEVLTDGSIAVALSGTHVATDQAVLSARCALALRSVAPDRPIALAMGRGTSGATWVPEGE